MLSRVTGVQHRISRVDVVDNVIWAMEPKAVNRFDGETWSRYESPFG